MSKGPLSSELIFLWPKSFPGVGREGLFSGCIAILIGLNWQQLAFFISTCLETNVVITWCSSCAGLALCALSTPSCVVKHFLFPVYLHYDVWELQAFWPLISRPLTHLIQFKIVIEIDHTSFKPTCVEYSSLCIMYRAIVNIIYWDEVALAFFCAATILRKPWAMH